MRNNLSTRRFRTGLTCKTLCVALTSILPFVAGCDEEPDIKVYEVDAVVKATAPANAAGPTVTSQPVPPPAAAHASVPDAIEGLRWTLPEGWQRLAGERPMRLATFQATKGEPLEIALSRFPGDTGGLLANVNRWRQQVGLPAIAEGELAGDLRPLDTGSLRGHTLRLRGPNQHMLGAILSPSDASETWFVKAVGTPAALDGHEADFIAFAASMNVESTSPATTQP